MPIHRRTVLGAGLTLLAPWVFAPRALAEALPAGHRPTYTDRVVSRVSNEAAIVRRFWVPGLDLGFVPQGLSHVGETLLVSGYMPPDKDAFRGPSRVYALRMADGEISGQFDLPRDIGHADGLASDRGNTLYLADGGAGLMSLDLAASLRRGHAVVLARRKLKREAGFSANHLAFDGKRLWFGVYAREGKARLHGVSPQALFSAAGPLDAAMTEASLPIPQRTQGAAFDGQGRLWLSTSTVKRGDLHRLDAATGRIEASYAMAPGIEDISFDARGLMWASSESGSRRWLDVPTFFPLVFAIDPQRLK